MTKVCDKPTLYDWTCETSSWENQEARDEEYNLQNRSKTMLSSTNELIQNSIEALKYNDSTITQILKNQIFIAKKLQVISNHIVGIIKLLEPRNKI